MNQNSKDILFGAQLMATDAGHVIDCVKNLSGGEDQRTLLCKAIAMLTTAADELRRVKSHLDPAFDYGANEVGFVATEGPDTSWRPARVIKRKKR